MSQACAYGDDATMATNYPLVRLLHANGTVHYCRTSGHSTMGVATGSALHTTNFHVPAGVPPGAVRIEVVANGIASKSVPAIVSVRRWPGIGDAEAWVRLFGSLADGPLWAWGPNGPVPVDPWGPKVAKEAADARAQILAGMRRLQELGAKVAATRAVQAAALPPAVDLEAVADTDAAKAKPAVAAKALPAGAKKSGRKS
jgi:hypothetical protein